MPIRTHRGRAAVYRRLWGWPLRSPGHLAVAVLVVVVAVSAVGLLLPEPLPSEARARELRDRESTSTRRSTTPTDTDRASPPSMSVPRTPPSPVPPDPAGLAVVDAWGRQWVEHPPGTVAREWLDRLRPYTTDEFLTVMSSVAPSNVPATAVTGPPAAIESTTSAMKVRLPTDAGTIRVQVTQTPEGWRVAGYNKVA